MPSLKSAFKKGSGSGTAGGSGGKPSPSKKPGPSTKASPSTKSAQWWKDVVCYQVWPLSFMDTNKDGNGDIKGIIGKLDHLEDLGIDVLWVSPTYQSPMEDYGYDISDWRAIADVFGTMKDMENLIKEVHDRDMKILLDLVVTHTSDQHPWFQESRSNKTNPKRDWYFWRNGRPENTSYNKYDKRDLPVPEPTNWRACFGGNTWTYDEKRKQHYLHLFLPNQPDLNWENEDAVKAIFENAIGFWLDKGVDGFRIDTVNRISKDKLEDVECTIPGPEQPATRRYINGPKSHRYLERMRSYMDNHDSVKGQRELMLVGELPSTSYKEVMEYVHPDNKRLNMVFDFDMIKLGHHDDPDNFPSHMVKNFPDGDDSFTLPLFKKALAKVQQLIMDGGWGTVFMENHDQCRSVERYATQNPLYYVRAAKLLCLLQTTLSGTQFIYQGQEIGMKNVPSGWGIKQFRDKGAKDYMEKMGKKHGKQGYEVARAATVKFGRDNGRTPMQWSKGRNAGFSESKDGCWIGVNDNCNKGVNVKEQWESDSSILNFWKLMIALRKEHKATFIHSNFEILNEENTKTFTYRKTPSEGCPAVVCLNFSDQEQSVYLQGGSSYEYFVGTYDRTDRPKKNDQKLRPWEGRVYWQN